MTNSKQRTLKLGLLVTGGLLLFILAIYYLGSKQNLFTSKIIVKTYFYDAAGIVEGSNVRYAGVNVGTVERVQIETDTTVLVVMDIDRDVKKFIRKDSKVEIGRVGLMGSKILLIRPGTTRAGEIDDGDVLPSLKAVNIDQLLQQAKVVIDNSGKTSKNLWEISEKINHGDGDLARLLNDDTFTTHLNQLSEQLLSVSKNANEIMQKINNAKGDLGKLVNDTLINYNMLQLLDNLDHLSTQANGLMGELNQFGHELNHGDGLIHEMVYDSTMTGDVDNTIDKVNVGIDEVVRTAETIRKSWIMNLFSGKNKKKKNQD